MYQVSRRKLQEYGLNEDRIERSMAILSKDNIKDMRLANGKIGGGASYEQVISLFFQRLLSEETYIQEAIREFSEELTEQQIRDWMSDKRGSYGDMFRIEQANLNLDERIRIIEKMALFKHYLLQRYFNSH